QLLPYTKVEALHSIFTKIVRLIRISFIFPDPIDKFSNISIKITRLYLYAPGMILHRGFVLPCILRFKIWISDIGRLIEIQVRKRWDALTGTNIERHFPRRME